MKLENTIVTREKLAYYVQLNRKKKEIESELNNLKKEFHDYFDQMVGKQMKGEVVIGDYKLQRQIRKTEKFEQEATVAKLESLHMDELIQKRPDEAKIKSALELGLLKENDLAGCVQDVISPAISVKELK
ncbi:hypothetical protein [Metabacillus malikii]|uniref:Uncharacterized protein n=1 Tax=Metabacillus malikii TaxID=1504265 RepID=A0ABT9ZIC6_9BACI|nr:hypothetical protein [Metabacillus malikii]MDQ0232029.1 hypothetical protein [Metabacillus malikii]